VTWLDALPGEALAQGAPLVLAALGGLASDAAGALNISLEGSMSLGALAYAMAGAGLGQAAGLVAAALAGAALAAVVAFAAFRLKADLFVAGLAGNLLAQGASSMLAWRVFGTKGVAAFPGLLSPLPAASAFDGLPVLSGFLAQRPITWILLAAAACLWLALAATPFGLRARAAGQKEESLALAGVDPGRVRLTAFLLSGAAAGLAGAALSAQTGAWVPGAIAGRGWIALVAVYLGGRGPGGTILASLAFALLAAGANALQGGALPRELSLAVPYVVTAVLVLAGKARLPRLRSRDDG
jgi:simple sugar transport system permease protein